VLIEQDRRTKITGVDLDMDGRNLGTVIGPGVVRGGRSVAEKKLIAVADVVTNTATTLPPN
jgi:hypothetical protein